MVTVAGYSYEEFCAGIAERDGSSCWVHRVLVARRAAQVEAWAVVNEGASSANWIPLSLLNCDGPMDGHHLLSKSWLKREYPQGVVNAWDLQHPPEPSVFSTLGDLLNDSRNGVCVCRRHHDLIERKLVVVRRGDLPEHVEEFAAELGDRAVARLERDFGRAPVSPVELRTGG